MTVEVLSPPVTQGGGIQDWVGCLSGSFNVPADWTIVNGSHTISNNTGIGTGLGMARFSAAACAPPALDQEAVAIFYQITSGGAGNTGYRYDGPGVRLGGTLLGNRSGYSFECGFVSGTNPATCNGNTLNFALQKWNTGVQTLLANSFSISGPTLTQGTLFRIVARQSGSNAIIQCYINGTLIYNVTDTSPIGAGQIGLAASVSCGGITPANQIWQYIKGRNL